MVWIAWWHTEPVAQKELPTTAFQGTSPKRQGASLHQAAAKIKIAPKEQVRRKGFLP